MQIQDLFRVTHRGLWLRQLGALPNPSASRPAPRSPQAPASGWPRLHAAALGVSLSAPHRQGGVE
ncbi:hypothetical protein [Thiomonas sp.]|uniref:hypothetical protein n=1 Tax=Thiomonas sp. TaxID=2047785 RepID=UPI00261AE731|nr:hypothetical protein [Thiomonas sp.]